MQFVFTIRASLVQSPHKKLFPKKTFNILILAINLLRRCLYIYYGGLIKCNLFTLIFIETEKVEAGLHCARVQSSKLRREVDLLRTGLQNEKQKHNTTVKELREFTKSLQEMLTEKGEDERQHIETRVQGLETTIKRLETYLSTEKTADKEVLMQETTRLGKICDQMEEGLRVVQENIKMISENQKEITGKSLQPENSAWEETCERRSSARQKGGMADRSQKDAGQRYGERQKNEGATIQLLYEGKFELRSFLHYKLDIFVLVFNIG